jgi:hypothetical protein
MGDAVIDVWTTEMWWCIVIFMITQRKGNTDHRWECLWLSFVLYMRGRMAIIIKRDTNNKENVYSV